jgi:UrcA family protein
MNTLTAAPAARPRAKFALLVLGSLAGVVAAGTAGAASLAAPAGDVPSVVVKYDGASLATDRGVNDLYRRIMFAARKVCPDPSSRDLFGQRQAQECRNQAVARAIRQIDNSQLAALYASHSKNS